MSHPDQILGFTVELKVGRLSAGREGQTAVTLALGTAGAEAQTYDVRAVRLRAARIRNRLVCLVCDLGPC